MRIVQPNNLFPPQLPTLPIHLANGDRGSEADEDFVEVLGESEDGGAKDGGNRDEDRGS